MKINIIAWIYIAFGIFFCCVLRASNIKTLPFQGRISNAIGQVVTNETVVVQFKLYNAPVGGQAVWNGEVQKLSVNNGFISTLLGSKASLDGVDFDQAIYLEMTLDANGDGQISLVDPPLLPRQSLNPSILSFESLDSRKLAGFDWKPIFGVNSPEGAIPGGKIREGSIGTAQLAAFSVTSAILAPNSVTASILAPNSIGASHIQAGGLPGNAIQDFSIPFAKNESRAVGATGVPLGGVALSGNITQILTNVSSGAWIELSNSKMSLNTTGPVNVMLVADEAGSVDGAGFIEVGTGSSRGLDILLYVGLHMDGVLVATQRLGMRVSSPSSLVSFPASMNFFVQCPAGQHEFSLKIRASNPGYDVKVFYAKLIGYQP